MNRQLVRTGIGLVIGLLLAGNLYLAFLLIDAGVSLDGAKSEVDVLWKRRQEALAILNRDWVGRPASELDALAEDVESQGFLVSRDGETREIGDFLFEVEDGVVKEVRDLDGAE